VYAFVHVDLIRLFIILPRKSLRAVLLWGGALDISSGDISSGDISSGDGSMRVHQVECRGGELTSRFAKEVFAVASIKTATARYRGGMRFDIASGSGHTLSVDVQPEEGGQDAGFSPMELPIMALVGCMGMDVVSILRKMRQPVAGYELGVRGVRAETDPKVFVAIEVEHTFFGADLSQDAIDRAIELSRAKYCSVSAMLEKTAAITHMTRIVAEGAVQASGDSLGPSEISS
jgi:putative redox protein